MSSFELECDLTGPCGSDSRTRSIHVRGDIPRVLPESFSMNPALRRAGALRFFNPDAASSILNLSSGPACVCLEPDPSSIRARDPLGRIGLRRLSFPACSKWRKCAGRRSIQVRGGENKQKGETFLKFFLIDNERERTFFQKNVKKGLAFYPKVRYNNTSF